MARINLSDREITIIRGLFNKELKHNDYMYKSLITMAKDDRIETTEKVFVSIASFWETK